MEMESNLQVCRVCLKTLCRLYSISALNLADTYRALSGVPLEVTWMPLVVCAVCAIQLRNARQLGAKSKRVHAMFLELQQHKSKISLDDIRGGNISSQIFKTVHFEPNHCDLYINTVEQPTGFVGIVKEESPSFPDAEEENYCYGDSEKKFTVLVTKLVKNVKDEDINGEESDDDDYKLEEPIDVESNHNLKMAVSIENVTMAEEKKVIKGNITNMEVESIENNVIKKRKRHKIPQRKSARKVKEKATRKDTNAGTKAKQEESEKETARTTMKVLKENFKVQKLSLEEQKSELEKVKLKANYIKSTYKCDTCYKGFKEEAVFNAHMLKHTEITGQHECPVCHLRFPSQIYYWSHKRSHTTLFSCNRCPFKTQHDRTAAHHLNWHRGSTYKCDLCPGVVFDFNTSLARHCRLYHPSALSCVFCGRGCQDVKGLQAHYQWKHAGQTIPEEGPRCEACNVTFANDDALAKHQSLQHDNSSSKKRVRGDAQHTGMFTCVECGKTFSMRCKLRGHMRKAHGRLPPPMSEAEKKAQVLAQRKQCHVCGRFFQSTSLLLDHMDVHTESASHPCPDCGKSFKTRARMLVHQRSHTMQYACPLCEKTFNLPGNRIRHYKNVHKTVKDVVCSFCSKGFKNKEECRAHELYVHLKIPRPARTRDRKRTGTPSTESSLKARKTL